MEHIIRIDRYKYTKDTTLGKMYINGEFFGHTLEDTVRGFGIKVKRHTAIPANDCYNVEMTYSGKYEKVMPIVYTEPAESGGQPYILRHAGVEFKGIRIHGGNTHVDTEGCPLICQNVDEQEGTIWGSLSEEINKKIIELLKTGLVKLEVRNISQKQ